MSLICTPLYTEVLKCYQCRPLYGCEGMLGKEDKMAGKSKVCKLMNLKKLNTKYGVHSSPLLLFRKFDVFHTLCVIFVLSDYRKCMEDVKFSKKQQRTAVNSIFGV